VSFTPQPGPDSGPGGYRFLKARAEDKRQNIEKLVEQKAMVNRDDEGVSEAPDRRGITERLRGIFQRRDASARPPERGVSGEDVWERERQHRREHEDQQSSGMESTLPRTRHRA
jgi:hypothetical protein